MSEATPQLHRSGVRDRATGDPEWCVLCGRSPMPRVVVLPDGCAAHPGCATDPVFAEIVQMHGDDTDG